MTWSARDLLLTRDKIRRTIARFTCSSSGMTKLQDFVPTNFTAAQKTAWFNPANLSQWATLTAAQQASATSDRLINYLRGSGVRNHKCDRCKPSFPARDYILGDIVNGKPVYVRVPPSVTETPDMDHSRRAMPSRTARCCLYRRE